MKKGFLSVTLLILSAVGATAQVTIGSTANPQEFSVLELVSGGTRGMRLPQFNLCEYQDLTIHLEGLTGEDAKKAQGLQVFNTCSGCVETWNGTQWIRQCEPEPPLPVPSSEFVEMPAVNCCDCENADCSKSLCVPRVRFMKYNLGADPDLDTPKEQMGYLATTTDTGFGRVYGGRFQWGRQWDSSSNEKSYAIGVEGDDKYKLYDGTGASNKSAAWTSAATYDDNCVGCTNTGQIINYTTDTSADGLFIYSSTGDWRGNVSTTPNNQRDDLWGNGVAVEIPTTDGITYNGNKYQDTTWIHPENNPCPTGFRVPTQDEWERICAYDCRPNNSSGGFNTNTTGNPSPRNNPELRFVPVICNSTNAPNKCVPNGTTNAWNVKGVRNGYAIYETDVWEAAKTSGVYAGWTGTTDDFISLNLPSLHSDEAPEPLLFLPITGRRESTSAVLKEVGLFGYYWSSTVNNLLVRHLRLDADGVMFNTTSRASGLSVRCVVE
jgi:hypothetical protein